MEIKAKIDITEVKSGMFWYEDDTFSFERLPDKKIKAIVELVENDVIYGDLTASEICQIEEGKGSWNYAKVFITTVLRFQYKCKDNERIVLYDQNQSLQLFLNYEDVAKAFNKIGKKSRQGAYWTSDAIEAKKAIALWSEGSIETMPKSNWCNIRPVLALKIK